MLKLENASHTFPGPQGEVKALQDVSLTASSGEVAMVKGESGSGKTTLLLTAGALLRPDSGKVLVDGKDPYALNAGQRSKMRASQLGFVFQQFYLVPYLSVYENILTPAIALPQADAEERARELLNHLKLGDRIDHIPAQLSAGECQRTALARALLNRPKILLADEPTGNLDDKNAAIVFDYLTEFAENGGAVLLVTHDTRATSHASRILEMENGVLS